MSELVEFKTGSTDGKCPNCGHYKIVEHEWAKLEHKTVEYTGWIPWKSSTSTTEEIDSGEDIGCLNCGWRDRYE